jgi:hypothetical protein
MLVSQTKMSLTPDALRRLSNYSLALVGNASEQRRFEAVDLLFKHVGHRTQLLIPCDIQCARKRELLPG